MRRPEAGEGAQGARTTLLAILVPCVLACGGGEPLDPAPPPVEDPDPLLFDAPAPAGSLDDLHERIIAKRCSGQPGLCHNGQFEPNLSTPALTYAYLVNRPSIEKPALLRVRPGNAAQSLFIDKIRNRNNVGSQMPLGAEPLSEDDTQALEKWIDGGALRAPGATAAPTLNNPPKRPEIGYFNTAGQRLDGNGPVEINRGQTIVLRHSVQDFETPDASMAFAAVILTASPNAWRVQVLPGDGVTPTTYDASGPMGVTDRLNYVRSWAIGAQIALINPATGQPELVDAANRVITVVAAYLDGQGANGILAVDTSPVTFKIK